MRQLTGLDTSFLRLETRSTYGHVSGLTVYDPSTTATGELTLEAMKELLSSRLRPLGTMSVVWRSSSRQCRQTRVRCSGRYW